MCCLLIIQSWVFVNFIEVVTLLDVTAIFAVSFSSINTGVDYPQST